MSGSVKKGQNYKTNTKRGKRHDKKGETERNTKSREKERATMVQIFLNACELHAQTEQEAIACNGPAMDPVSCA